MLLILLLCIPVQSTPIKEESLDLSESSIVRNKFITLLNKAKKLPLIYKNHANEIEYLSNQKGERKARLFDLDDFKKQVNHENIKLAFNDEASDLLKELTRALVEINENLSMQNKKLKQTKSKQIYVVKMNEDRKYARRKRDTDDVTQRDSTVVKGLEDNKNTTVTEAVSKKASEENSTTEAKPVVNETNINKTDVPNCNQTINGRRNFNDENNDISKAVKNRLLSYISEYFNDITTKTNSLRDIKRNFSASDEYSIGYIIANIDTLGINLHDLRVDIELNHQGWSEKQILDMFDRIKMSHGVVVSLLEALKSILAKTTVKYGKRSQYLRLVK